MRMPGRPGRNGLGIQDKEPIGILVLCKLSCSSHASCLAHTYFQDKVTVEMLVNLTDRCNVIHTKANQMGSVLWSLLFASIAAYLVWSFGSGAPWWVYPLLFARPVLGFAHVLAGDPAARGRRLSPSNRRRAAQG